MYLWRVNRLVDAFKNDKVTEKDKFKYFLIFAILLTIVTSQIIYLGYKYSHLDLIELVISLIIVIWGCFYCYFINKCGDNKDFITRFICLALPISIRLLVFYFPLIILVAILDNIKNPTCFITTIYDIVLAESFSIIWYLLLGNKLKEISQSKSA
jgi:hypothetical protein